MKTMRKIRKKIIVLLQKSAISFFAIWMGVIMPIFGGAVVGVDIVEDIAANSLQTLNLPSTRDVFISTTTPIGDRNVLSVGNYVDITTPIDWRQSKSFVRFSTTQIPSNAVIISAKLKLHHFASQVSGNVSIGSPAISWNESMSYYQQSSTAGTVSGQYTNVFAPVGNYTATLPILTSGNFNTSGLNHIRNSIPNGFVDLALYPEVNDSQTRSTFCSATGPTGTCSGGSHPPKLEIEYIVNQAPFTPAPVSPTNQKEFSGNCDESIVPSTGACRTALQNTLTLSGVGDGDSTPGDHRTVYFKGTNSTNGQTFEYPKNVNIVSGSFTNQSTTQNFSDGVYQWRGYSIDKLNLRGQDSVPFNFTTDTTPPSVPVLNELPEYTKGVGIESSIQFEIYASDHSIDNIATRDHVGYILQYSTDEAFINNTFTKPLQRATDTLPRFELGPKGIDEIAGTADDITTDGIYYFRVKAQDKPTIEGNFNTSAWSNTVSSRIDATAPVASNVQIDPIRFSPQNTTSVGQYDLLNFSYSFTESNPKAVGYEILDNAYNVIYRFTEDATQNIVSTDVSYSWNGLSAEDVPVNDGSYIIRPYIEDLAGNTLTIKESEHQRLFTLDNTGVDVIFNQGENLWINNSAIKLTGQVIDVGDLADFVVKGTTLLSPDFATIPVQGGTYNEDSDLFELPVTLVEGTNSYIFETTDTVGNKQTYNRNINLDTVDPEIIEAKIINNKSSIISSLIDNQTLNLNDSNARVEFIVQDFESGIPIGTNPSNLSIDTVYKSWNRETSQFTNINKELFKSGVNLDPNFTTDLVCTAAEGMEIYTRNGVNVANTVICSFQFTSLGDTEYILQLRAKDLVGNLSEQITSRNINVDAYVYLETRAPQNFAKYPSKTIEFVGYASKNAILTIQNTELSVLTTILIDSETTSAIPDIAQLKDINIVCGTFINHDNNAQTLDEEVCRYEFSLEQYYDPVLETTANTNILEIADAAGNIQIKTINTNIAINNFAVAISPSGLYLSPNGDGNHDDVTFLHFAYNPEDAYNRPIVQSYRLDIKNSTGEIVKTFQGSDGLPASSYWDLLDTSGSPLPDGEYRYQLSVVSTDEIEKTSVEQSIYINSAVEDATYISTPLNNTNTNVSVVTIEGQAPQPNNLEQGDENWNEYVLKGQTYATICVDALIPDGVYIPDYIVLNDRNPLPSEVELPLVNFGQGNNVECDHWQEVIVDENGFFSTIIIFPAIEGMPSVTHNIVAYTRDDYGNATMPSNEVLVTVNSADPFVEVYLEPTLTGITSPDDYAKFLNGEISIEDIRSLRIRSVVTEGTEQVELSFADYSNLSQRPNSPTYNFIALLTDQIETNPLQNPRGVSNIKYNHNKQLGDATIPYSNCVLSEETSNQGCVWDYLIPMNEEYGGIYEIKFKGKKGTIIEEMTRGFQVDGRIPAAPVFMIIEKWDNQLQMWVKMENVDYDNFTNISQIRFRGAAEPFTKVELWTQDTLDENGNIVTPGIKFAELIVGNTGIWEMIIDLEDFIDQGGSIDGLPGGPNDTGEACTGIQCFRSRLGFVLKGFKVDRLGTPVNLDENGNPITVISDDTVVVNYDKVAPQITSIVRTTPEKTIQGWARTGDQINFEINTNEQVFIGEIIKEDGFVRVLQDLIAPFGGISGESNTQDFESSDSQFADMLQGVINMDDPMEGIYNVSVRLKDYAENIRRYDSQNYQQYGVENFQIYVDNTIPDSTSINNSTTEWSQTWSMGGINTGKRSTNIDGNTSSEIIYPVYEVGRTNPEYVTSADYVEIKGRAEKNQRVEIFMAKPNLDAEGNLIPDTRPIAERGGVVVDTINISNNNCIQFDFDKQASDGLTTKYNSYCDWSFEYYFEDNGANTWDGTPLNGYVLQARVIDMAANVSDWSNTIIIYHDTQKPIEPEFTQISSASYTDSIPGLGQETNGKNTGPITKDVSVNIKHSSERFSDVEFFTFDPKQITIDAKTFINGSERISTITSKLGTQTDERANCVTKQGNKRVGICEDGFYTFGIKNTDAVGNQTGMSRLVVERDTVAPETPGVSVYMMGLYQVGATITGEAFTTSSLGILPESSSIQSTIRTLNINVDSDWSEEGNPRFHTLCSNLVDRAGNVSGRACDTVQLPVRPPRDNECSDGVDNYFNSNPNSKYAVCTATTCSTEELTSATKEVVDSLSFSCRTYAADAITQSLLTNLETRQKEVSVSQCIGQVSQNSLVGMSGEEVTNYLADSCPGASEIDPAVLDQMLVSGILSVFQTCLNEEGGMKDANGNPTSKIDFETAPERCREYASGLPEDIKNSYKAQVNIGAYASMCLDESSFKDSNGMVTGDEYLNCLPSDSQEFYNLYSPEDKEASLREYNFSSCLNTNFENFCTDGGCGNAENAAKSLLNHCADASGISQTDGYAEQESAYVANLTDSYAEYIKGNNRGDFRDCGFLGFNCWDDALKEAWHYTQEAVSFVIETAVRPVVVAYSLVQSVFTGDLSISDILSNIEKNLDYTSGVINSAVHFVGGLLEGVVGGIIDMAKALVEFPMQVGIYGGAIISSMINGGTLQDGIESAEEFKEDMKNATGWDLGSFGEDMGNFIMAAFTIATFGAGSAVTVVGRSMAMTVLRTVVAPALLETGLDVITSAIKGEGISGAGIALGLVFNLIPGAFDIGISPNKLLSSVFKGADEITDGAGNIIKKADFQDLIHAKKIGAEGIEHVDIVKIKQNFSGNIADLNLPQLDLAKQLTDVGKTFDDNVLKNIELPTGTKIADLPTNQLDNITDAAKYGPVDIDMIKKSHGEGILNDPDNILFAMNNPCTIADSGGIQNIFIQKVYASGCKIPVDSFDGVTLKRGNVANHKSDLIDAISFDNPNITNDSLSLLEYNHRIPVSIAKQYPEAVSGYLKDLGIDDLNKFGDLMNHSDNVKHYWSWRDNLKDVELVDKNTIKQIIEDIEINGKNRGIDYINNVYR